MFTGVHPAAVNSPKNFLLAFLALTSLGGAILAWQQYGELVELRAGALHREERADLQKRIVDLERLNRELQDQLAAARGGESLEDLIAGGGERAGEDRPPRDRSRKGDPNRERGGEEARQRMAAFREAMAKPEVQALISAQQKAAIEGRYAALFNRLNLTPEQSDKLKTLLAERGNVRRDVEEAARAQGINPRENPEAFRKLFTDAQNDINASIKSAIGEQGFAQLQNYEQTMPQRNLVENLQQRLTHSNAPLTSLQAEQLVQILAANAPQRTSTTTAGAPPADATIPGRGPGGLGLGGPPGGPGGPGGPDFGRMMGPPFGGPGGPGGPGGAAIITPAAVAQAQTVLLPTQVSALQQLQQQQQTRQQLDQIVRDTLTTTTPATTSTTPGAPAPSSGPTRKRGG